MSKKILVTGADGFIGSHLVEELTKRGYAVRAFVMYNSFNSWGWLDHLDISIKNSIEIFPGDIRDPYAVKVAMKGCVSVIHLAALIAIPYSYYAPDTYLDVNIRGTMNLLQAARELNLERVIHTSTSEVYGSANYVPIDEDHPIKGQSPYSASKIAADQMAYAFYASFQLPVSIIRPFNTYGPRQSARAVIPTVISQIISGAKNIKIGSLAPTRDFSYIDDTVSGFIAALEADQIFGEIINLGSGFEISIGKTIELIQKCIGVELDLEVDDQRIRPSNSEVNRLFSNNSKAKSLLKWEPKYGGLDGFERGLIKTIEWISSDGNLKYFKSQIYNI
jgi:dTDP-glucose 4,6-dehydratase